MDDRDIPEGRTLSDIEQSLKALLANYAFASNDAGTWAAVRAAVAGFLAPLWTQGVLIGKVGDAFSASCGLGSTMSAQDVLEGRMNVAVTLHMPPPEGLVTLTFTLAMPNPG
jgi:uncharacterized protein